MAKTNCKHHYIILRKGEYEENIGETRNEYYGKTYEEYLGCKKCGNIKKYEKK